MFTFTHSRSPYSLTHLHCYYCAWLISYPFDSISFVLNARIADASLCRFSLSLRVSLILYDSTLSYLYKYCSLKTNVTSDLVSLWIQDTKPSLELRSEFALCSALPSFTPSLPWVRVPTVTFCLGFKSQHLSCVLGSSPKICYLT